MSPIIETRPGRGPEHRSCRIHLPSTKGSRPPAPGSGDAPATDELAQPLRCVVCNAAITSARQAIEVNGSHEHAFFNPAGIAFAIRCFRTAPGAAIQGAASDEFTWFPGYHWRMALCAACQAHLGWRFAGPATFFGLIGSRLR